jgi:hypothetical protein
MPRTGNHPPEYSQTSGKLDEQQKQSSGDDIPGEPIPLKIVIPPSPGKGAPPLSPAAKGTNGLQSTGQVQRPARQEPRPGGSVVTDGAGLAPLDLPGKAATVKSAESTGEKKQPQEDFYSRFGIEPVAPGVNRPSAAIRTGIRPDPAKLEDLSGDIPPLPSGQPAYAAEQTNARNIPPIGRVIQPIVANAPPEIPLDQGSDAFAAGVTSGVNDAQQTPTQRFGTAIPSFAARQTESGAGPSDRTGGAGGADASYNGTIYIPPPNLTVSSPRGPAGQMGR